jgi:hypothetical protein
VTDGLELARWARTVVRWQPALVAVVLAVPAALAASVVPYRQWDAQAFGMWSRVIAETGGFHQGAIASNLHRPLFYVAQGYLWRWIDDGEWVGRWLSLSFTVLFVVALWLVARRIGSGRDERALLAASAVSVALASSLLALFVASGMTDVPVAATATATAAAVLWRTRAVVRLPLVALAACATVLAKPSGLVALAGVALAAIAFAGRGERRAMLGGLGALCAGGALGLLYHASQASRLNMSLSDFLRTGNSEFYLEQGAAARADAVLEASWLGDAVRLAVLAGLAFAVGRAAGLRPRPALAVAGPASVVWSLLGPVAANGDVPYPLHGPSGLGLVGWAALAATLVAAPLFPVADPLPRRAHVALLLWLVPGATAWVAYRSDDVRLLSPAWAPLILLAGAALAAAAATLGRRRSVAALAPLAALSVLVVANVPSVDGLRRDGWRELLELGPSGWRDRGAIENFAYGPFSYELDLVRANLSPTGRVVSSDARLQYFFPGRAEVRYARTCAELRDAHATMFVLLLGDESVELMHRAGGSADPLAWEQCASPTLHPVGSQDGIYAAYVVGEQPARTPAPEACRVSVTPGQLLDGVFVSGVPYARARAVRDRAAQVGYASAKIERINCGSYRVVVTGIPTPQANQDDFLQESSSVGFHVTIRQPLRYPEVPPDAAASR